MYEIFPKKTNKNWQTLIIALLAFAAATMFVSSIPNIPYRSVFQIVGITLLALTLCALGRYVFSGYSYAVVERDDTGLDLTVTEIKKKSRITVCRISLSGIEKVVRVKRDERKTLAADIGGRKKYNYSVDFCPAELCYVFAEECGESLVIILAPDDELIRLITPTK